jgi:hypothetical protein
MLVAVLVSDSVLAVLPPLFVLVSCTGLIVPNATALALERQGELAGSASAVLGLAHFGFAAVVPPLASVNGVSPVVLGVTTVTTAAAAAAVHVLAVRPRSRASAAPGGEPAPQAALAGYAPFGVGTARPAPSPFVDLGEAQPPLRRRQLQWVPVAEPDGSGVQGWQQPVGPVAPSRRRVEPVREPRVDFFADPYESERVRIEQQRREEWRRIAELARRARLQAELEQAEQLAAADTDPVGDDRKRR